MKVVISSGHGKYVKGANFYIDEVTEARKVVSKVAVYLKKLGVGVIEYHDNASKTQKDNVNGIVKYHNSQIRDLDVSVHFNANQKTDNAVGTETLYYSEKELAVKVSKAISEASGLKDRGAKLRTDLGFLMRTKKPAILIEVCFVDSTKDVNIYNAKIDEIAKAIAEAIAGKKLGQEPIKTEVAPKKEEKKSTYRILSGTFNSEKEGQKGLANMKSTGAISVGYVNKDGSKYRVLTGTFDTKEKAEKAVKTIKTKFNYVLYVQEY